MSLFSELRRRNVFRVAVAYSVAAWLVAQVADLALDSFGTPDWVIKTILFLLLAGFPFALIFAWAYELTPEGIKPEKDVDRSQSITQQTGRKLNYAIIGVLIVALLLAIATRDVQFGSEDATDETVASDTGEKSIAVLPFVNMSDDPDNEYFSDGISEELLNVLVKVEGLRVASRTSTFSFKDKDISIPDIAAALNVEHVLEGSVRKAGDTVRITAQLIDVRTDSHLWSETYDRRLEDVFVIQDEISAHIVEALRVALGAGEITRTTEHPTENLDAYEDWLRGRHFWQRRGEENIRKAIELFERATKADPLFAKAWSSLAAAHLTMPAYSEEPDTHHYPLALEYAEKALQIDATMAESHAVIADMLRFDRRWIEAEQHYLKAIEFEPKNSTGFIWYAEQMCGVGYLEKCLANALVALELDPFNAGANSMASFAYFMNGDDEPSLKYLRTAWDLGHPGAVFQLIEYEITHGNIDAARAIIDANAEILGEEEVEFFGRLAEAVSDPSKADAFLEWSTGQPDWLPLWQAFDYMLLGRVEPAAEILLEHPLEGGDWAAMWRPDFGALRSHPDFAGIVEASGLIPYWDKFGWPSYCSRDGEKITCR